MDISLEVYYGFSCLLRLFWCSHSGVAEDDQWADSSQIAYEQPLDVDVLTPPYELADELKCLLVVGGTGKTGFLWHRSQFIEMISRPIRGDLAVPVNLCQIRYLENPSHGRYIRLATRAAGQATTQTQH